MAAFSLKKMSMIACFCNIYRFYYTFVHHKIDKVRNRLYLLAVLDLKEKTSIYIPLYKIFCLKADVITHVVKGFLLLIQSSNKAKNHDQNKHSKRKPIGFSLTPFSTNQIRFNAIPIENRKRTEPKDTCSL